MTPVRQTDELDSLLHLESTFQDEGAADSQEASARAGHNDGRALGWAAGTALSSELSFYHGAAHALLVLADTYPSKVPIKAVSNAQKLIALSEERLLHRIGNDASLDMDAHTEAVRTLFRTSMAQAGLIVRYDRRASRMADLSF